MHTHAHGTSTITTTIEPQGALRKKRRKECEIWRWAGKCCLLDVTYGMAAALMSSQKLWIPAPDLDKPDEIPT